MNREQPVTPERAKALFQEALEVVRSGGDGPSVLPNDRTGHAPETMRPTVTSIAPKGCKRAQNKSVLPQGWKPLGHGSGIAETLPTGDRD